jgi:hypothetical protein
MGRWNWYAWRMKLYRFSPVRDEAGLREALAFIHQSTHQLCEQSLGEYLPIAGNIGFFCHYDDEYAQLTELRERLTEPSDNPDQKYFRLLEPIVLKSENGIPEVSYTHLYIRKPDIYRAQVGDVDFAMEPERYQKLKLALAQGEKIPGARIFPRADLDMIELYDPDIDALGYISVSEETERVRAKTNFA